jgi:hypothetical protein
MNGLFANLFPNEIINSCGGMEVQKRFSTRPRGETDMDQQDGQDKPVRPAAPVNVR